jgi:chaperone required for assembly of F1-ATPase
MRDILDDIFKNNPLDPMESARKNVRASLRKRFYEKATVEEGEGGFRILLDGKTVKTPLRHVFVAPSRALAQAIAEEWNAQKDVIDPTTMPLTRLANTIIDGVAGNTAPVAAEIEKYLGSDLLIYRAEGPEGLVARQSKLWGPVLAWARDALGARFVLAQGVSFVTQPEQAVRAAAAAIPSDPWRLGATHSIMTITGSALLALAVEKGAIAADEAWAAGQVDEDWNASTWGQDPLAQERNAHRHAELEAAARVLALLP